MPLAVKVNVALREQNFQKIGSERVKRHNPYKWNQAWHSSEVIGA